jgi:transcriptional regulator with XRE-family HTH domain
MIESINESSCVPVIHSPRIRVKATGLLRHNIRTLLRSRGQTPHDLAFYCRKTDAWISKILSDKESDQTRGLPLKYLDKIADFFGVAPYQLFQPGISPLAERRMRQERRCGRDRRIRAAQPGTIAAADLSLSAEDVALLLRIKSLGRLARLDVEKTIAEQDSAPTGRRRVPRSVGSAAAAPETSIETPPPTAAHPASRQRQG